MQKVTSTVKLIKDSTEFALSGSNVRAKFSIIKKHEGHIDVESEVGAGTTCYIYLPASEEKILTIKDRVEVSPGVRVWGMCL